MKTFFKIIGAVVLAIIAVVLIGLGVLAFNSPGKLDVLTDKDGKEIAGSISEKNFVDIGGIKQGFFIRGENPDNPVILYLHGGPGSPELPIITPSELAAKERLEKYFTVCYWEQRGAGISYSDLTDSATMNTEQMVEDTRQMTEYLKKRFNREKIYLMGHSWGSYLGAKTVEKYPENYLAYIGVGQITNQMKSEELAYDYMLKHATEINDEWAIENLEKYGKSEATFKNLDYLLNVRNTLTFKYGIGLFRENASMLKILNDILFFKGYTLSEKLNGIKGMSFSSLLLWKYVTASNLFEPIIDFQLPVYIAHGKYDYVTSYELARQWLDKINAPKKGFFTFENSAHSPNMEEYDKFVEVVREIAAETMGVP